MVSLDLNQQSQIYSILSSPVKLYGQEAGLGLFLLYSGSTQRMAINEYRRRAVQCLCIADENTTSPENRMLLVGMAQAWLRIAQRVEQIASAEILSETASPPIAAASP